MRRAFVAVASCVIVTVLVAACGKSEPEKRLEDAQQAADQMSKGAEGLTKGMEEMAKSLQGMNGDQKPVDPVSFTELQTVFPDLAGWTRGKPIGEKMTSPVNYSEARVTYTKGDSRIEAKVTDAAFNGLLTMGFAMMTATGYEKQTSDGFEKSTKVGSFPGWEKRNDADKSGELGTLVNQRFVLSLEGSGLDDNKPLYALAQAADLKKLAAIK